MKQQTAVEWFIEQLPLSSNSNGEFIIIVPQNSFQLFTMKAKQMEQEQIVKAYQVCYMNDGTFHEAEYYYNETYGGQGSPDTTTSPNTQNK